MATVTLTVSKEDNIITINAWSNDGDMSLINLRKLDIGIVHQSYYNEYGRSSLYAEGIVPVSTNASTIYDAIANYLESKNFIVED